MTNPREDSGIMETRHVIVDESDDQFILQTDSGLVPMPKTDYFVLKLKHFDGNRIFYTFGQTTARVEETFDDGIFNCWHGEHQIQIADGEGIAKIILEKDYDGFFVLFAKWHGIKMQKEIIDAMIRPHGGRIKHVKDDMYEIDNTFAVDSHGVAHYRAEDSQWRHLCLVAKTSVKEKTAEFPGLGPVVLNEITQTILAKIMFLLYPKPDRVFMNQLPEYLKKQVLHLIKANDGAV